MTQSEIHTSISAITSDIIGTGGIAKGRQNQQQHYNFRGVEDFLNTLAPLLPKHGVIILPRLLSKEMSEHKTASGGTMYHALAEYAFDFVSTKDGSSVTAVVQGEAMDSGDKAFNKTISMAYKYACTFVFCIPTSVDDADNDSPEPTISKGGGQVAQKFISEKGKYSSPNATETQTEAPKPNGNGTTPHPITLNVTSPTAPVLNLVKPPIITNLSDKKYQALIANSVLFKLVPDNKNLTNMFAAIEKAGYPELTDTNVEEVWKKIKPVTGGK